MKVIGFSKTSPHELKLYWERRGVMCANVLELGEIDANIYFCLNLANLKKARNLIQDKSIVVLFLPAVQLDLLGIKVQDTYIKGMIWKYKDQQTVFTELDTLDLDTLPIMELKDFSKPIKLYQKLLDETELSITGLLLLITRDVSNKKKREEIALFYANWVFTDTQLDKLLAYLKLNNLGKAKVLDKVELFFKSDFGLNSIKECNNKYNKQTELKVVADFDYNFLLKQIT